MAIMPPREQEYRQRAEAADERASQAQDPQVREQFQRLAGYWRELADMARRAPLAPMPKS